MTRITSIADVLARFLAGQCRRRPRTMADVLGQFRKRDGRRAYFAVRHKREQRL